VSAPAFASRAARGLADNGAVLLALENRFNPTLALSGSLRAGAAHSPDENPVLAGLTAEMLDKGTRRRGKLEIARELESRAIGISFSASGGDPDTLDISLSCLSRDAAVAFSALVEMLTEPSFPEAELSREKERLIGSVRQMADQTGWRAQTAASRLVYPRGYPYYSETAEEIVAAIEKTTRQDLADFHAKLYGGATLVLAAVGDLDRGAFVEDFRQRLRAWPRGASPERALPAVGPPAQARQVVVMKEKVNADVVLAHHGGLTRTDSDFLAATLGVSALGQSTLSSRLGLRVRDTEGLTYGINARIAAGRNAGSFTISLTVAPQNLARAVASAREVAAGFVEEGVTEKEIRDEKRSRIGKFKVDLASNAGIAGALDMAETYGLGVEYLDRFPSLVESVTREEIDAAVRRHIRPAELVEVAAGDL
jgi:zinc protease